jgi:aerobic C4-dicarboxylate transport protein
MSESAPVATPKASRNTLYLQVLVAIVIGILLGYFDPGLGEKMKPLGDAFVNLVKMLIGPIIFTTVVVGLAGMGDLRKVGRVGLKAIIYFEVVTTLALMIGLVVANVFTPGEGFHANPATLDTKGVARYAQAAKQMSTVDFLLHIIPKTFVGAFAEGEILQMLLLALLFGMALGRLGDHGRPILNLLNDVARVFFGIVTIVTQFAPVAAAGAMAYTIGQVRHRVAGAARPPDGLRLPHVRAVHPGRARAGGAALRVPDLSASSATFARSCCS